MKFTSRQIAGVTGGRVLQEGVTEFDSFGIDSRKIRTGGLFFALKGEVTDGHLFVDAARRNGAGGAVVQRHIEAAAPFTLIVVPDSLKALHDLAASVRNESSAQFVGITGSSGKTSTKEFTASLLSGKYNVFKSEGNLNSVTGMPLSLLSLNAQNCAVFEVGMNQPGEISALSQLLRPQTGVLLNVNPVHIGQFPSIEEVADEKYSLVEGMRANSTLIYNADDLRLRQRATKFDGVKISFALSSNADLTICEVQSHGVRGNRGTLHFRGSQVAFETELCGSGNLYNIGAAAAVAFHLDVPAAAIAAGIAELKPYSQRGVLLGIDGVDVYDDSYNSNPKAFEIALDLISQSTGYKRKIIVTGDMLELGPQEVEFHREAGRQIAARNFDVLITAGPLSKHTAEAAKGIKEIYVTENSEAAAEKAAQLIRTGDLVLVKGSRGMKMEKVIDEIRSVAVSGRGGALK